MTKTVAKLSAVATALLLATTFASAARAELLSYWSFNNGTTPLLNNVGSFLTTGSVEVYNATDKSISVATAGVFASSSLIDLSHLNGPMGGAVSTGDKWGTFAGNAVNVYDATANGVCLVILGSGNNGASIEFRLPTTGYKDLIMTFSSQRSSTGFNSDQVAYSIDGGANYTNFSDPYVPVTAANTLVTMDFSSVAALDNVADARIRITLNGATAVNGNNRFENVQFNATKSAIAGDFDSDGDVDGADFVAWQTNFPKESGAALLDGDADADGDVDGADFVVWQANFPYPVSAGVTPVPEPSAWLLAISGVLLFAARKARR